MYIPYQEQLPGQMNVSDYPEMQPKTTAVIKKQEKVVNSSVENVHGSDFKKDLDDSYETMLYYLKNGNYGLAKKYLLKIDTYVTSLIGNQE